MSSPDGLYNNNYTVYTGGSTTPNAGPVPPSGSLYIGRVVCTATVTGNVTITDGASGPTLFLVATPTAGAEYELRVRVRNGMVVTPGSAGTVVVYWD